MTSASVASMGELEVVLDVESRRHNRARVTDSEVELRGRPPYAELGAPMDPDVLDAELDLGWLITWWPQAYRRWGLVDLVSRAEIYSGGWTPFRWSLGRGPAEVRTRVRIGWLGDKPDLDPARTGWPDPPQRYRLTTMGPAQELVDGVEELVGLLPPDGPAHPPVPVRWPDWVS